MSSTIYAHTHTLSVSLRCKHPLMASARKKTIADHPFSHQYKSPSPLGTSLVQAWFRHNHHFKSIAFSTGIRKNPNDTQPETLLPQCVCLYSSAGHVVKLTVVKRWMQANTMLDSSHHSSAVVSAFPHFATATHSNTQHMQLLLSSSSCAVPGARASVQPSSLLNDITPYPDPFPGKLCFHEMNISSTTPA